VALLLLSWLDWRADVGDTPLGRWPFPDYSICSDICVNRFQFVRFDLENIDTVNLVPDLSPCSLGQLMPECLGKSSAHGTTSFSEITTNV